MRTAITFLLVAGSAGASTHLAAAVGPADWPCFRGPLGTGLCGPTSTAHCPDGAKADPDTGGLVSFDIATGKVIGRSDPSVKGSAPGGYSSLQIADGRLFSNLCMYSLDPEELRYLGRAAVGHQENFTPTCAADGRFYVRVNIYPENKGSGPLRECGAIQCFDLRKK